MIKAIMKKVTKKEQRCDRDDDCYDRVRASVWLLIRNASMPIGREDFRGIDPQNGYTAGAVYVDVTGKPLNHLGKNVDFVKATIDAMRVIEKECNDPKCLMNARASVRKKIHDVME